MIRQKAFENNNRMLKGGLHCHTTRSDGRGTPEEVIKMHADNGYDFLALTDHRVYNRKDLAPGSGVLMIPGIEVDAKFEGGPGFRCFHVVCIGPDDETNGFNDGERVEFGIIRDQFDFQRHLDQIRVKGNLAFYCHPEWSSTPARYFDKLEGLTGMEIWNTGCVMDNDMDTDAAYWDELLGMGHWLNGIATDDGHGMDQHCKGWVMVNSQKDIRSVLQALEDGSFYSSCGPVIKDFYIEDGFARIFTDPCSRIIFHSDRHPNYMIKANAGELLTFGEYDLRDDHEYIRASVVDVSGRKAWTNPLGTADCVKTNPGTNPKGMR